MNPIFHTASLFLKCKIACHHEKEPNRSEETKTQIKASAFSINIFDDIVIAGAFDKSQSAATTKVPLHTRQPATIDSISDEKENPLKPIRNENKDSMIRSTPSAIAKPNNNANNSSSAKE